MPQAQHTEDRILRAGVEIFAGQGYRGLSIKNITSRLGLTKAAFYAHFKSKTDLLHRLIQEYENKFLDELIHKTRDHPGNVIDKIHFIMSFISEFGVNNPELIIGYETLSSELRTHPVFEPALTRVRCKLELFMTDLFKQGLRQGLLRKDLDPGIGAKVFLAISRGMFQEWIFERTKIDGHQYIRTIRWMFYGGLTAKP